MCEQVFGRIYDVSRSGYRISIFVRFGRFSDFEYTIGTFQSGIVFNEFLEGQMNFNINDCSNI